MLYLSYIFDINGLILGLTMISNKRRGSCQASPIFTAMATPAKLPVPTQHVMVFMVMILKNVPGKFENIFRVVSFRHLGEKKAINK